jgi:hypothetical protein
MITPVGPLAVILALVSAPATVVRTVAQGSDSPIRERTEVVIRTSEDWEKLSKRFAPNRPVASVDFSREMVVGLFAGFSRFSGLNVEIYSVAREGSGIVARYRERSINEGDARSDDAAPYHLVAVPRDRRRVHFVEVRDLSVSKSSSGRHW